MVASAGADGIGVAVAFLPRPSRRDQKPALGCAGSRTVTVSRSKSGSATTSGSPGWPVVAVPKRSTSRPQLR